MSWSEAFLRQARSDLSVYAVLQELRAEKCHRIHYLQMAGEKLAKSESDEAARGERPGLSHFGLSLWLRVLGVSRAEIRSLGFKSPKDFQGAKIGLLPTAQAIEHLAPKIANDRTRGLATHALWNGMGTNAEYPWDQAGLAPVAPVDYAFAESDLNDFRLHKLALLIDARIAQKLGMPRVLPRLR